jgi:hypothetical protein
MHSGSLFRGACGQAPDTLSLLSFYPFIPSWIGWKHCLYGMAVILMQDPGHFLSHFPSCNSGAYESAGRGTTRIMLRLNLFFFFGDSCDDMVACMQESWEPLPSSFLFYMLVIFFLGYCHRTYRHPGYSSIRDFDHFLMLERTREFLPLVAEYHGITIQRVCVLTSEICGVHVLSHSVCQQLMT